MEKGRERKEEKSYHIEKRFCGKKLSKEDCSRNNKSYHKKHILCGKIHKNKKSGV